MICKKVIVAGSQPDANGWIRPGDWLAIPEIVASEQKICALLAVTDDDSNYAAIQIRGAYTVDWGDGTVVNANDNALISHKFEYSALPSSSYCSRGYRQALVTITPQGAGDLTSVNFHAINPRAGMTYGSYLWLDIRASCPKAGLFQIGGDYCRFPLLERLDAVSLGPSAYVTRLLRYLPALKSVFLPSDFQPTDVNYFLAYSTIDVPPLFDTSLATEVKWFLYGHSFVRQLPAYDFDSATDFYEAFSGCTSLSQIHATNIGASISFAGCMLGADALVELFGNLKTVSGGQTLNITGNHGLVDLTIADWNIAAAKKWKIYPEGGGPVITDDGSLNVTITSSGGHLVYPVYYTVGGGDPTVSGILYEGPFAVNLFDNVTAVEYRTGYGPTNRPHPYAIIS